MEREVQSEGRLSFPAMSLVWLAVLGFAWVLRMSAAGLAYPAQGDASHFVQHGVRMAETGAGLSGYWSLAPQFLACWAYRAGWDPSSVLQISTVLFGVLLVLGVMCLASALALPAWIAVLVGLVAASNPILVESSVGGLSETPYMALVVLAYAGIEWALGRGRFVGAVVGGIAWGLALYYRPFEAALGGIVLAIYLAVLHVSRIRRLGVARLAIAAGAMLVVGAPFLVISSRQGALAAGHSKLVNLAFRDHGLDSKAARSLPRPGGTQTPLQEEIDRLRTEGTVRYLWNSRAEILRKAPGNLVQAGRWLNGYVFSGAFSMGMAFFVLFNVWLSFCIARSPKWPGVLLPLLHVVAASLALCLSFVHPRWIIQFIPIYLILVGFGLYASAGDHRSRAIPAFVLVILFVAQNASWAVLRQRDNWMPLNVLSVGHTLRSMLEPDDVVMCFGPELAVQSNPSKPWNYVEMPYATLDEVEAFADEENVAWVVLSDRQFAHYPVQCVFAGCEPPATWLLAKEYRFGRETRWGAETECYRIYKRTRASGHPRQRRGQGEL